MKLVQDWNEEYLFKSLPVGEFDWFEVKSRKSLDLTLPSVKENHVRNTLSKAISAFSNTGGGVIIYGIQNPSGKTGKYVVDDGGIAIESSKGDTKEWLETIIPNLVEFPLNKFNVYPIYRDPVYKESQISQERALYLIDIPDSENAPHQANDNKYYARVASRSKPIGHRLIVDIMGRRKDPFMDLDFSLEYKITHGYIKNSKLIINARNNGKVFARYVNCFIWISKWLLPDIVNYGVLRERDGKPYVVLNLYNTVRDVVDVQRDGYAEKNVYGPSQYEPILPGLSHFWDIRLLSKILSKDVWKENILWKIYADNSTPREGIVSFGEIEHKGMP